MKQLSDAISTLPGPRTGGEPAARPRWSDRLTGLTRYATATGIVAITMLISEILYRVFDTTRLSMVFLAGVLVAAVTLGSGPAYFAAALAFFCYNVYLVEPRFTFTLDSPEDVLVLMVFLAVAMLTGRLAGQVKDEARRAQLRAQSTSALLEASRDLSATADEDAIRSRLARHMAQAAKGEAAILLDGQLWRHPASAAPPRELLDDPFGAAAEPDGARRLDGWRTRPLTAGGAALGLATWRPADTRSLPAEEERLTSVLADLGAAAIARARAARVEAEVEALAQTERLRNALLSSISHDLRTPLAAILASASSLREFGQQFEPEVRDDLVQTIQEEAERLNRFVANLLNITKLESGALSVSREPLDVQAVLRRVRERVQPRAGRRRLVLDRAGEGLHVLADPLLLEQAVFNVVDNAVRFSPDESEVRLSAAVAGERVAIEVADQGPGVPACELERIFEKFYRSAATAELLAGTGLGLSISRGLIEAMDGGVRARRGEPGLTVAITLPRAVG